MRVGFISRTRKGARHICHLQSAETRVGPVSRLKRVSEAMVTHPLQSKLFTWLADLWYIGARHSSD